ncbi:uncharacterized protein [Clytia hemisphaerica]|uniref:Uncharacterized protein n=1 Tax=Clytia hemisphaerica TaxID=252671 RepID=A0A7M5WQL2_9CNID
MKTFFKNFSMYQLRSNNFWEWFSRHWRSFCIILFVACSCILIALISIVAWSYYNGVVATTHSNGERPKTEFLDQQWVPDSSNALTNRPNFVNSDSSELNFDELQNSNSVNSALMHPVEGALENGVLQSVSRDSLLAPQVASGPTQSQQDYNEFMKASEEQKKFEEQQNFLQMYSQAKPDSFLADTQFNPSAQQNTDPEPPKSPEPQNADQAKSDPPKPAMTLYKVTKATKGGAVCLDGSPPAYYHRPGIGPNERSWIIHFNGGAWCFDPSACVERSHSSLGSTNKLPKSPPIIQGINSPNPQVNPDFYDWNLVWVVYCDGASFTGNRERPIISKSGQTIYLRGKRVLNAIINDLLFNRGFKSAESVILTGSSAGSMAAIFQADYIASRFPTTVPVRVLADAGFFIDTAPIGGKSLEIAFKKVYEMQNASAGLNQDCTNDFKNQPWKCFLPAIATQYVKTPMYVLNSAYDIWALIYFLGIDCKFSATGEKVQRKRRQFEMLEQEGNRKITPDQKLKRDVSGFEMRPFFRSYISKLHHTVHNVISSFTSKTRNFRKASEIQNITSSYLRNRTSIAQTRDAHIFNQKHSIIEANNTTLRNFYSTKQTQDLDIPNQRHKVIEAKNMTTEHSVIKARNTSLAQHSLLVMTSTNATSITNQTVSSSLPSSSSSLLPVSSSHLPASSSLLPLHNTSLASQSERVKKTGVQQKPTKKNSFSQNLKSIEGIVPEQIKQLQQISDETQSVLNHHISADLSKSNTPKPTKGEKRSGTPHIIDAFYKRKGHQTMANPNNFTDFITKSNKKRHVLKQRRSTSIAREYINILRSDPPECTAGEMTKALQYRDAILKATNNALSPDSGRFIVSCIDHSMSLFDETWTGIKIHDKSIQQAFGDWFFNRVPREKSTLVDCKYPCNQSCP